MPLAAKGSYLARSEADDRSELIRSYFEEADPRSSMRHGSRSESLPWAPEKPQGTLTK